MGVASGDSNLTQVRGVLLCLDFFHVFSKRPFKLDDDGALSIFLTYPLACIFLGALLIKVDAQPEG